MNSNYGFVHNYFSKIVYIHIFTTTNVGTFWPKMYLVTKNGENEGFSCVLGVITGNSFL